MNNGSRVPLAVLHDPLAKHNTGGYRHPAAGSRLGIIMSFSLVQER